MFKRLLKQIDLTTLFLR